MKDLLNKEIILKVTGEVQESNIDDFKIAADIALSNINTELVTDQDFGQAKEDIISCEAIEKKLAQLVQDITTSSKSIAEATQTVEQYREAFRQKRLAMNNLVKKEEISRKKKIVQGGVKQVKDKLKDSPAAHGFSINIPAIQEAIKGKRSLAKMQEAVDGVVASEIFRLSGIENTYKVNMAHIERVEQDFPGLFPDKKNLALKPDEVVESEIKSRVAEYQLKQQQKAEAERKEEDEKQKAEDAAKVRGKDEQERNTPKPVQHEISPLIPNTPPMPDQPPMPTTTEPEYHTLEVTVVGSLDVARSVKNMVVGLDSVIDCNILKG